MNLSVNNFLSSNFTPSFNTKMKNEKNQKSYISKDHMIDFGKNISKLGLAKDTVEFTGIFRSRNSNNNTLKHDKQDKVDALDKLLKAKYEDGIAVFDGKDINNILYYYTSDKADALDKLLDAKKKCNNNLNGKNIGEILAYYTPDKADALDKLLDAKKKYDPILSDTSEILTQDELEKLLGAGYKNGFARFNGDDIKMILYYYTPDKADALDKLLQYKNGNIRFDSNIKYILKHYTPDKADALNKLLDAKYKDGYARFGSENIGEILAYYTPDKADTLNKLLDAKYKDGDARFGSKDIVDILKTEYSY